MSDTKQSELKRDEKGRFNGGTPPAGFNVNPQNRHNGVWKKEDTPRFKLEKMMALPESDLKAVAEDKEAPLFERKLAVAIRNSDWKTIDSMINQVYGKPKEFIDHTTNGKDIKPILGLNHAIPSDDSTEEDKQS